MDKNNFNKTKEKFSHLTYEERVKIASYFHIGYSYRKIASLLNRNVSTISREIIRNCGKYKSKGKTLTYNAQFANDFLKDKMSGTGRKVKYFKCINFINEVEVIIKKNNFSLASACEYLKKQNKYERDETLCIKTLYNYVSLNLLSIKNENLPEKLNRKKRKPIKYKNKKIYGESIENRPKTIDNRAEFGHWELDLVIGSHTSNSVLLTMIERKTRLAIIEKLPNKRAITINKHLLQIFNNFKYIGSNIFKTITTDNGSEFALLNNICKKRNTNVYFTHPYSAFEKGSIETFNRLIRRFIKKGTRIENYTKNEIKKLSIWANRMPRKILDYSSAIYEFNKEVKNLKIA